MEAHSEEEYEQHVRPFRGREWPDALLRFSVRDNETPHESQRTPDDDVPMDGSYNLEGRRRSRRHEHHHGRHHGHHRGHRHGDWPHPHSPFMGHQPPLVPPPPPPPLPPPPPPPPPPSFPPFYGPPPPPPPPFHHGNPFLPARHPFPIHMLPIPPVCNFTPIPPSSQPMPPTAEGDAAETPLQKFRRGLRSVSSAPVLGPTLPVPPLPPRPRPVSQFGEGQAHDASAMHQNVYKAYVSDELEEVHDGEAQSSSKSSSGKEKQRDACCDVERTKQEILDLMRVFKADVGNVLSRSIGVDPTEVWGDLPTTKEEPSEAPKSSSPIESEPAKSSQDQPMEAEHSPPPSPVIHANIICDQCRDMIIGVRHKCLDCPDFDLCTPCLSAQPETIGFHSRTHAFFAIEEPGGLWAHAVFSGNDTPEPPIQPATEAPTEHATSSGPVQEQNARTDNDVLHNATCDLCSSGIKGVRFKCLDCPDFDVCSSCYAIVPAQHPGHGFARLREPTDLKLPSIPLDVHCAGCNSCGNVIRGTRYKCMHPSCKDFDLCANCEALPIPVHPIAHAMLKIRQPSVYIPMVKRYGTEGVPIPTAVTASNSRESQEEDARKGATDPFADLASFQVQSAPTVPSTILTPIAPNIPLPETTPVSTTVPVHSESEPNAHRKSAKGTVSFTFGSPSIHEGVDQSQSGRYTPTAAAPLLPAPSPPPALATEFIRSVPFLHQDGPHTQERVTLTPDVRTEPWWGQSTWIPPTPPAPLPVPLRTPSTPRRSRSPDPLIRFDTATSTFTPTLVTPSTLGPKSDSGNSHPSLPHVPPPTDFNELFDLASQFRHLLELPPVVTPPSFPVPPKETPVESEPEPALTDVEEGGVPTELASTQVDGAETPLSLVALLSKPEKTPRPGVFDSISPGRLLSQILDSPSATSLSSHVEKKKTVEGDAPLRASFVADNNIPDGQIFPPGAEFVKSWRMRNDGPGPWPAETELVFVAGDKLVIDKTERFKVGSVAPGEEVDVWTGEMKAPDVPGKYISYWRLCDTKGRRFGHSIWVDICVAEQSKAPTPDDGNSSLSASSIVMPHSAPSAPSAPIPSHDESTTAPLLSDASSVSLIDVPSDNEDEEDNEVYEDSRSHFGSTPANGQLLSPDVDYVVLSDGSDDL